MADLSLIDSGVVHDLANKLAVVLGDHADERDSATVAGTSFEEHFTVGDLRDLAHILREVGDAAESDERGRANRNGKAAEGRA